MPNGLGDYRRMCFVIMPFGTREVPLGGDVVTIDFDAIYDEIFRPAIEAVELPASEGDGHLEPHRADETMLAGVIDDDMFHCIEYARFTLADITSLNANVMFELGHRHRARAHGTVLVRLGDASIPFDINHVRVSPYAIDPEEAREAARDRLTEIIENSLVSNRIDSPIWTSLQSQWGRADVERLAKQAEQSLLAMDPEGAEAALAHAVELDGDNPLQRVRLASLYKDRGAWPEAIEQLHKALANHHDYADAHRELGIAIHKVERQAFDRAGEADLRRAVRLAPSDFDAWSSLGGILKRAALENGEVVDARALEQAIDAYDKATTLSNGHPYPTLNFLKLRHAAGYSELDGEEERDQIEVARAFRKAQIAAGQRANPDVPHATLDSPWAWFDLAECELLLGRPNEAKEAATQGLAASQHDWMPATFLNSLEVLDADDWEGLSDIRRMLKVRMADMRALR